MLPLLISYRRFLLRYFDVQLDALEHSNFKRLTLHTQTGRDVGLISSFLYCRHWRRQLWGTWARAPLDLQQFLVYLI